MTNEEARSNLEKLLQLYDDGMIDFSIIRESIKVAIEALKAQPNLQPTCNNLATDTISRQAAIDAMTNTLWHYPNECYRNLNEYEFAKGLAELGLKSVPSAQPEIVRCKECMNHGKEICYFWSQFYGTINTPDDGFCYKAERRTDG